jgi:signal transduction histidine kinase
MYKLALFLIFVLNSVVACAQFDNADSFTAVLKQPLTDLQKLNTLAELYQVQLNNAPKLAEATAREGLNIAKKLNNKNEIANFYRLLASSNERQFNLDQAQKIVDSAKLYLIKTKEGNLVEAEIELLEGNLNRRKAQYELAMQHFIKAEQISETLNSLPTLYTALTWLGTCNVSIKNYGRAKQYHNQAIAIATKLNDYSRLAKSNNNIGIIHRELEEFVLANTYFNKALSLALQSNDSLTIANTYAESGNAKTQLNLYAKAREHLTLAKDIYLRTNNLSNLPYTYFYLADLEAMEKNIPAGQKWINEALHVAIKADSKKQILDAYNSFHYFYMNVGMFDSALANYKTYKRLDEATNNAKVKTNIEELNIKYETQRNEAELKKTKLRNSYYFIGIISLLSLLGLMYSFYSRKQLKLNLAMQQAITEEQIKANAAIVKAEETERQRISRDLHDNMGAYTSALIANTQALKAKIGEHSDVSKIQTNAESILHSLRDTIWVLNNKTISLHDFNDAFKNYCFKVLQNFEYINFETNEDIQYNDTLTSAQALHLNKILQEAIQNIIKHAKATKITYTILDNAGTYLSVFDNGVGFDEQNITRGFGLENMRFRAAEVNFELEVTATEGNGTLVTLKSLG